MQAKGKPDIKSVYNQRLKFDTQVSERIISLVRNKATTLNVEHRRFTIS